MKPTVAVLIAACLALTACDAGTRPDAALPQTLPASASASADPGGPGFNATDVMFAQMLIPHHGQGIAMVKLVPNRATNPELKLLAAAIQTTQAAEVETMAKWLRDRHRPAAAAASEHAAHGGMPMTSEAEFKALTNVTGTEFDRRFLNTMIAHQDDAIQIASMETGSGANAESKALAKRIQESRRAQIKLMLGMLKKL